MRFRDVDGPVLLEQCRALDKKRLVKRLGEAPEPVLSGALRILRQFYEE